MARYSFLLPVIALIFSSCDKQERNIHNLAGVYTVEKIERTYYSNGNIDSTLTDENPGELCLYDNASDIFNNIANTMDHEPFAWGANGVGGSAAVGWYTNPYHKVNSITFFSEGSFSTPFATYTITRFKSHGKMEWRYAAQDGSGSLAWTETIVVNRKK